MKTTIYNSNCATGLWLVRQLTPYVDLMLVQRVRRWPSIAPTLSQWLVFAGYHNRDWLFLCADSYMTVLCTFVVSPVAVGAIKFVRLTSFTSAMTQCYWLRKPPQQSHIKLQLSDMQVHLPCRPKVKGGNCVLFKWAVTAVWLLRAVQTPLSPLGVLEP